MRRKDRVVVGMSGGVDSAVAAYLLKTAGYDVIGVTLKTWIPEEGKQNRCCEIDGARASCDVLGIPYHVANCVREFEEQVQRSFAQEYLAGRTPNPCVGCNRMIKWKGMLDAADMLGAEFVATGHYAQVVRLPNGRYTVQQAADTKKDQTYMLYQLTQEQLSRTMMPLGRLSKAGARRIAEAAGLPVAHKADSQEICFIPDGNYGSFVEEYADADYQGEGDFVDGTGLVLGRHKGIVHYTVGQRKGLGLAMGHPVFVNRIDAQKNQVVVGELEDLYEKEIICKDLNFLGVSDAEAADGKRVWVKVRYHHSGQWAALSNLGDGRMKVVFEEPVKAAAPGQSAVFYFRPEKTDKDADWLVFGGGVIL